jgi:hypothetical protein
MTIVGSLVVGGIGAVITVTMQGAKADAVVEERVHEIRVRVDKHEAALEEHGRELGKLDRTLERIDQRTLDIAHSVERVETKQDEALKRGAKGR